MKKSSFKTGKRFSYLISELESILNANEKTDEEKLKTLENLIHAAKSSICPICLLDEVEQPVSSKGLCSKHYGQKRANEKRIAQSQLSKQKKTEKCTLLGCQRKIFSKGYCSLHWNRVYQQLIDPNDFEAMNRPPRERRPNRYNPGKHQYVCKLRINTHQIEASVYSTRMLYVKEIRTKAVSDAIEAMKLHGEDLTIGDVNFLSYKYVGKVYE